MLLSNKSPYFSPPLSEKISFMALTLVVPLRKRLTRDSVRPAVKQMLSLSSKTRPSSLMALTLSSVREVLAYQVARSRGSPSLGLWCAGRRSSSWMRQQAPWMPRVSTRCSRPLTPSWRARDRPASSSPTDSPPSGMLTRSS